MLYFTNCVLDQHNTDFF